MKKNNYFPMPNEIFCLGLSSGEIAVYSYLMSCEDRETYQCYPSYTTITQLIKNFTEAVLNGVSITVITRPPEDFKEQDREIVAKNISQLQDYGIKVIEKAGFHQKFTIIDQDIVWYGSVNFLSFGISEESIMRFTNADIAGRLMDTVIE